MQKIHNVVNIFVELMAGEQALAFKYNYFSYESRNNNKQKYS